MSVLVQIELAEYCTAILKGQKASMLLFILRTKQFRCFMCKFGPCVCCFSPDRTYTGSSSTLNCYFMYRRYPNTMPICLLFYCLYLAQTVRYFMCRRYPNTMTSYYFTWFILIEGSSTDPLNGLYIISI